MSCGGMGMALPGADILYIDDEYTKVSLTVWQEYTP